MKNTITLKIRIWFWWDGVKRGLRKKYERIRYLVKRRFQSNEIPKDEFDPSLDMNFRDLLAMNEEERDAYYLDLIKRRDLAHEADNARTGNP